MSFTSKLKSNDESDDAVIKKTPQIFDEILSMLSANVLSEKELSLLKKDLLFTVLVVIMIENGFQPVLNDCAVFDLVALDVQRLSQWKHPSGLYEAEFVMLGYSEISTKLILTPLATTAIVNAIIYECASEAYSVCLPIDKYFVFNRNDTHNATQMFSNLQQLSDTFKNKILSPVKSKILSICGYPGPSLLDLPEDIFLKIMLYLPISDIISLAMTCKKFYQYLCEDNFWHKLFMRDYHNSTITTQSTTFQHDMNWKWSYITCYKSHAESKEKSRRDLLRIRRRGRFYQLSMSNLPISLIVP